ncbi:hypothetical protein LSH36_296g01008 [Paralvinella palmiformis]|uniref:U1 small nuclear ribonucleoprotein 70 kDa n=1 Tax=Paralvinella palmiformis TaxID=53620 RepID=A0AAD9JIR3_9ANNE|nr:hypothetical protein LSH36_296g01008 [Paralvinella palmiformis]
MFLLPNEVAAYKHADGKKIDGRRVLVDVERGRTIKGWRPRRLGGGLGGTRKGGPDVNTKYSGREDNFRNREDRSVSRNRSRSRSPARRRRRSRSRERRHRSRTPKRRSRERSFKEEDGVRKRSRRSRSRERRRSRSRERKRSKRSRSRERKPTRDRRMEENAMRQIYDEPASDGGNWNMLEPSQIKSEPVKEGYDKYDNLLEPAGDEQFDNGDNEQYNGDTSYQERPQQQYEEYPEEA